MAMNLLIPLLFVGLGIILFMSGRHRALAISGGRLDALHSKPSYHGTFLGILALVPAISLIVLWLISYRFFSEIYLIAQLGAQFDAIPPAKQSAFLREAYRLSEGITFGEISPLIERASTLLVGFRSTGNTIVMSASAIFIAAGGWFGFQRISRTLRARQFVERSVMTLLIAASAVAIVTTLGIVLSLIFESIRFFEKVPFFSFIFGTHWSPQSAFEGAGAEASARNAEVFGAVPIFAGTALITLIAILVAAPIGLMAAIYLSD